MTNKDEIENANSISNIVIYQNEDGSVQINAKIEDESVWLTQQMMVDLFQSSKANINEHISHIFKEEELEEMQIVRNFRTVRKEGNKNVERNIKHYNLDMVISVGYRVKSKVATHFRKWATTTLRDYFVKGYVINNHRLLEQSNQLITLKSAIEIIERGIINQQAKQLHSFLKVFSSGLKMLDDYDHERLDTSGESKIEAYHVKIEEYFAIIDSMKASFSSDVFGVPKDSSFESSVRQIYQSFGGIDCYETLEEKAAMLLYLIIKNHSFIDGNKRIAASAFLYFLDKNNLLKKLDGNMILDNNTLFALTILIAESKSNEMEVVKNIVITILNRKN